MCFYDSDWFMTEYYVPSRYRTIVNVLRCCPTEVLIKIVDFMITSIWWIKADRLLALKENPTLSAIIETRVSILVEIPIDIQYDIFHLKDFQDLRKVTKSFFIAVPSFQLAESTYTYSAWCNMLVYDINDSLSLKYNSQGIKIAQHNQVFLHHFMESGKFIRPKIFLIFLPPVSANDKNLHWLHYAAKTYDYKDRGTTMCEHNIFRREAPKPSIMEKIKQKLLYSDWVTDKSFKLLHNVGFYIRNFTGRAPISKEVQDRVLAQLIEDNHQLSSYHFWFKLHETLSDDKNLDW